MTCNVRSRCFCSGLLTRISKVRRVAKLINKYACLIVRSARLVIGRGFTMPGMHLKAMLKERSKRIF